MDAKVRIKGILVKETDEIIVKLELEYDDLDKAVRAAKIIEKDLENILIGQTKLK